MSINDRVNDFFLTFDLGFFRGRVWETRRFALARWGEIPFLHKTYGTFILNAEFGRRGDLRLRGEEKFPYCIWPMAHLFWTQSLGDAEICACAVRRNSLFAYDLWHIYFERKVRETRRFALARWGEIPLLHMTYGTFILNAEFGRRGDLRLRGEEKFPFCLWLMAHLFWTQS